MTAFRRPAQEHMLTTRRLPHFHVLDWPGEAPPVVLMHGNKSISRAWDFLVDASTLANRFIAPDMRGHGLSAQPATGYAIQDYVDDVLDLLDGWGIRKAIFCGYATGGYMALAIADQCPELAAGILVVDAGLKLTPALNNAPRQRVYDSFAKGRAALNRSDLWDDAVKDHYARYSYRELPGGGVEYRYFEQDETPASRAQFDVNRLKVRCPTLFIRGEHSDVTAEATMREVAALIPGARCLTVAGSHHHVPMDKPARLAVLLDEFVRGLGDGGAGRR